MSEQTEKAIRARAKRWTEDEAHEALREWRGSGLSATAFAGQKGISAGRLAYWEQRLGASASADGEVGFVAVPLSSQHMAELEHQGVTIRVRELSIEELAQLVVSIARRTHGC
jgi:hypothetical protein